MSSDRDSGISDNESSEYTQSAVLQRITFHALPRLSRGRVRGLIACRNGSTVIRRQEIRDIGVDDSLGLSAALCYFHSIRVDFRLQSKLS